MIRFSASLRKEHIQTLQKENFDLLVIGGGITGAGIALDAASRGLKVALVEKKDFAWGTSSRSTKLVHGGLRYLKQMEFGLVKEVGLERAVVHNNARHIVIPERMLLPIVKNGSLGKTMSSLALWVYDYLANVEKEERRKMLGKEKTIASEPLLRTDILKGGGLYYEYRSDDARLTIENLKTACEYGALPINYMEVIGFSENDNGKLNAAQVKDQLSGETFKIKAKEIINAAGPWVDGLRRLEGSEVKGKRLYLTKGVHIVVPGERLPIKQSVYFDVEEDNRMVFAIPRDGITYIGTTDTKYQENTDRPRANHEDVEYILRAANFMFPSVDLTPSDVISTWAGLRPLIHEEGKGPSELSRKDEIFLGEKGLVSIAGGKLTGYRKMAERVVDVIVKRLQKDHGFTHIKPCSTANIRLGGGQFDSQKALDDFLIARTGETTQIGLMPNQVRSLVYKYGTGTDLIIEKAFELYPTIQDAQERIWQAELWYSMEYEMTCHLNDYFIRRTGRLYFERPSLKAMLPFAARQIQESLSLNSTQIEEMKAEFLLEYEDVMAWSTKVETV